MAKSKVEADFMAFTDGACHPNPGIGGWGYLMIDTRDGARDYVYGGNRFATNNSMEYTAMIRALRAVPETSSILILTDSRLMVNTFTKWIDAWKRRGWRKVDGGPIANLELVRSAHELITKRKVSFRWIKGHSGISGNEQADRLATMGRRKILRTSADVIEDRLHLNEHAGFRASVHEQIYNQTNMKGFLYVEEREI